MRKPDDSSLTPAQYAKVRAEAQRALGKAGAIGRFPTPVADIMAAAEVEEISDDVLSESFLVRMRKKAGAALKRALGKVLGVFDARARLILVDRTLIAARQTFIRLHETGHGFMRWQRDLYAVVEETELTIAPDIADLFDREANAFATEVLFQLDGFSQRAEEQPFGILVPVRLCKKYGASIYAAVRRYVSQNRRACAVLVLDPPVACAGDGFRCNLRRVIASPRFHECFGSIDWPDHFTPGDTIGAMVPVAKRRMSGQRSFGMTDRNGGRHECIGEAFTNTHQTFILIHASESLRPAIIPVAHRSYLTAANSG